MSPVSSSLKKIDPEQIGLEDEDRVLNPEEVQKKQLEDMLVNLAKDIREQRLNCNCASILIVEDDEFIRIITKAMLLPLGFEIQDVGNGALGVEAVARHHCDYCQGFLCVLMDYDMPVMNGMEATRKIREELTRELPIVAVSAFVAA